MLIAVAKELDAWMGRRAQECVDEGMVMPRAFSISVHGQMALLESRLGLHLVATQDVDVHATYDNEAKKEFERLLAKRGLVLDPVGHEAWMPKETKYSSVFVGEYVTLKLADVESVLISKARMAPEKNGALLTEYLAKGASERFLLLVRTYAVDLEQFL